MNETMSMDSQTGKDHWGRMNEKGHFWPKNLGANE